MISRIFQKICSIYAIILGHRRPIINDGFRWVKQTMLCNAAHSMTVWQHFFMFRFNADGP